MAVTNYVVNSYLLKLIDGSTKIDHSTGGDNFKCMILDSGHTPDIDNQEFIDDVSGDEVSGTGYDAGGKALTSQATSQDDANDRAEWDFADVLWTTVTFTNGRYAVFYKDTGTPGTSPIIEIMDFDANKSPAGDDFQITINADGSIHYEQGA